MMVIYMDSAKGAGKNLIEDNLRERLTMTRCRDCKFCQGIGNEDSKDTINCGIFSWISPDKAEDCNKYEAKRTKISRRD